MSWFDGNRKYLFLGLLAVVLILAAFYIVPMLKSNNLKIRYASTSSCDSISSYSERVSCVNSNAISQKDAFLCLSLQSGVKLSGDAISCILNAGKTLKKPSFCQTLNGNIVRIDCYKQVFKASSQDAAYDCNNVLPSNLPGECFTSAAVVYKNSALCKSSDCMALFK